MEKIVTHSEPCIKGDEKRKEKFLVFSFRGEVYCVNEKGYINKSDRNTGFSETWIFLGGSHHHWCNHITVTREEAFKNPEKLNKCLGWDLDHGSVRQWSGSYHGKLPRTSGAYTFES